MSRPRLAHALPLLDYLSLPPTGCLPNQPAGRPDCLTNVTVMFEKFFPCTASRMPACHTWICFRSGPSRSLPRGKRFCPPISPVSHVTFLEESPPPDCSGPRPALPCPSYLTMCVPFDPLAFLCADSSALLIRHPLCAPLAFYYPLPAPHRAPVAIRARNPCPLPCKSLFPPSLPPWFGFDPAGAQASPICRVIVSPSSSPYPGFGACAPVAAPVNLSPFDRLCQLPLCRPTPRPPAGHPLVPAAGIFA